MPHPVDRGAGAIESALLRLQRAVGELEAAADAAGLRAAAEDEDRRSDAADDGADGEGQSDAIAAVLARLDDTVARLRAVIGDDPMPDLDADA